MTAIDGLGEPPKRRRGCLFWGLLGLGVAIVVVAGLATAVVLYARANQTLQLPADGGPIPTSPPVTREGSAVEVSDLALEQGDTTRHVAIVSPPDIAPGERLPLVVLLHGHSESSGVIVNQGDWKSHVIADRFIVAAPEGISQSWNAGGCCRLATTLAVQDVAFLDAVIADLSRRDTVDPARVYLAGMSNGGMMAYRYACEHADRLAGMASVEGTNVADCTPSRSLPVLHIAGTADRVVPYDGGRSSAGAILATRAFPAVPESLERIAEAGGCAADPELVEPSSAMTVRRWSDCRRGATVQLETVHDLAHVWPKGDPYDATDAILRFFGIRA